MDGNLNTAKACIQAALKSGMRLTTDKEIESAHG